MAGFIKTIKITFKTRGLVKSKRIRRRQRGCRSTFKRIKTKQGFPIVDLTFIWVECSDGTWVAIVYGAASTPEASRTRVGGVHAHVRACGTGRAGQTRA